MTIPLTIASADFDELFINDTPLIDVRAPVEFTKGAFPSAVNLPIMNDDERHQVGVCYQESGQEAAIRLGHELINGETKIARVDRWLNYLSAEPEAKLYCFRGGERSKIACGWLESAGLAVPKVAGGYKALRQHLIDVFSNLPDLVIVSGKTGTGKTTFLDHFDHAIDLEGIANHRGSAFGGHLSPQPTQIGFENALAIEFLKQRDKTEILLEDEGRLIGRIHLPLPLQERMKQSPILVIEESVEIRVTRIFEEYIVEQWQSYSNHFAANAPQEFENYLLAAADAIQKRLGGVTHQRIRQQMIDSCREHKLKGSLDQHREWISTLLTDYYDPMYNYQMEKKAGRVQIRGDRTEVVDWYARNLDER